MLCFQYYVKTCQKITCIFRMTAKFTNLENHAIVCMQLYNRNFVDNINKPMNRLNILKVT